MTDPRAREELKYAHLGHRDTPARRANRAALDEYIAEIQHEIKPVPKATGKRLEIDPRYRR